MSTNFIFFRSSVLTESITFFVTYRPQFRAMMCSSQKADSILKRNEKEFMTFNGQYTMENDGRFSFSWAWEKNLQNLTQIN